MRTAHRTRPRVPQVDDHGFDLPYPCDVRWTRHDDRTVVLALDASTAAVLLSTIRDAQLELEREARRHQQNTRNNHGNRQAARALRLATIWDASRDTSDAVPQPYMD